MSEEAIAGGSCINTATQDRVQTAHSGSIVEPLLSEYGIEIDAAYVDLIVRRLVEATGEIARDSTDRTFDEVTAGRNSG